MAVLAQALDEVEHLGGLGDAERGRGLVEHDDLGVAEERARDRHGLALAAREAGDRDAHRGDAGRQLPEQAPALLLHRHLVEGARVVELAAEEEVGDDVEVVAERQVLEDGRDAEVLGLGRAVDGRGLAVELHGALVGRVDARDGLDERRLAGAVVADQGDDLVRADVEVDAAEGLHGAEALGDPPQREHGRLRRGRWW